MNIEQIKEYGTLFYTGNNRDEYLYKRLHVVVEYLGNNRQNRPVNIYVKA